MAVRRIFRVLAGMVDDVLSGLDNGARWLNDQIGVFGLTCLGLSAVLLVLLSRA